MIESLPGPARCGPNLNRATVVAMRAGAHPALAEAPSDARIVKPYLRHLILPRGPARAGRSQPPDGCVAPSVGGGGGRTSGKGSGRVSRGQRPVGCQMGQRVTRQNRAGGPDHRGAQHRLGAPGDLVDVSGRQA